MLANVAHILGIALSDYRLTTRDNSLSIPFNPAISFSDVAPECVAPLHPAYSKYVNWTTFLGTGRAEFGTSDGMTREVGAGHIVYFDDAEGAGHAYKVANYKPVKQIFITLEREVTRW